MCLSVCINTYNTVKLILSTQAALWVLSPPKPLILESLLLDSPAPVGKLDPVNKSSGWIHVGTERQTVSDKVLELDSFRSELCPPGGVGEEHLLLCMERSRGPSGT